jgi:hypothetical protein
MRGPARAVASIHGRAAGGAVRLPVFVLMRLEDYALLLGSLGLLLILGFVMYLTRKIDWFNAGGLRKGDQLRAADRPSGSVCPRRARRANARSLLSCHHIVDQHSTELTHPERRLWR